MADVVEKTGRQKFDDALQSLKKASAKMTQIIDWAQFAYTTEQHTEVLEQSHKYASVIFESVAYNLMEAAAGVGEVVDDTKSKLTDVSNQVNMLYTRASLVNSEKQKESFSPIVKNIEYFNERKRFKLVEPRFPQWNEQQKQYINSIKKSLNIDALDDIGISLLKYKRDDAGYTARRERPRSVILSAAEASSTVESLQRASAPSNLLAPPSIDDIMIQKPVAVVERESNKPTAKTEAIDIPTSQRALALREERSDSVGSKSPPSYSRERAGAIRRRNMVPPMLSNSPPVTQPSNSSETTSTVDTASMLNHSASNDKLSPTSVDKLSPPPSSQYQSPSAENRTSVDLSDLSSPSTPTTQQGEFTADSKSAGKDESAGDTSATNATLDTEDSSTKTVVVVTTVDSSDTKNPPTVTPVTTETLDTDAKHDTLEADEIKKKATGGTINEITESAIDVPKIEVTTERSQQPEASPSVSTEPGNDVGNATQETTKDEHLATVVDSDRKDSEAADSTATEVVFSETTSDGNDATTKAQNTNGSEEQETELGIECCNEVEPEPFESVSNVANCNEEESKVISHTTEVNNADNTTTTDTTKPSDEVEETRTQPMEGTTNTVDSTPPLEVNSDDKAEVSTESKVNSDLEDATTNSPSQQEESEVNGIESDIQATESEYSAGSTPIDVDSLTTATAQIDGDGALQGDITIHQENEPQPTAEEGCNTSVTEVAETSIDTRESSDALRTTEMASAEESMDVSPDTVLRDTVVA